MDEDHLFDHLVQDGMTLPFAGWDFLVIGERWQEAAQRWDYVALARECMVGVQRMLDMDTGGGEVLASLVPLPAETYASEYYAPNILVARERLEPLGVEVVSDATFRNLPFSDGYFDLVLNRHGGYAPGELRRVLKPGGIFLTQQGGGKNNIRLNELLQEQVDFMYSYWTLEYIVNELQQAGFEILQAEECYPESVFLDIGAVLFCLRIISWQVADFSVEKYREKLYAIHRMIQREGKLVTHDHRVLVEAQRPA